MYDKTSNLVSLVLGRYVEPCIQLYSDYDNKSGAVSVIICNA